MIPINEHALIEDTVRGFPSRELIRSRGRAWTTEHIDYALSRIQQFTEKTYQEKAEMLLLELRADILHAESEQAATVRQAATDAALADLRKAVQKGPAPHWTQSWGFWVSVIAALAALIAAWPVIKDWLH